MQGDGGEYVTMHTSLHIRNLISNVYNENFAK